GGVQRLRTYGSSRISASERPRSCSRITYAATRSSWLEPVKRNEKGFRRNAPSRAIGAIVSWPHAQAVDRLAVRRARAARVRRVGGRGAHRGLDRAQGGRDVGRRTCRQSAAPVERRAARGRLRLRGARARG